MADAAASSHDPDYHTDIPVGEILKRARLHFGQSLGDVERNLRIRAIQLDAIECGDVDRLPGRVYAIGFVKSYAEYLGLDGDKIVALFKAQMIGNKPRQELNFPVAASDSNMPPLWLALAGLAVFVFIVAGWAVYSGQNRITDDTIPVVEDVIDIPKEKATRLANESYGPALPAESSKGFLIRVRESSWVEIRDGQGRMIISRVLQSGHQYTVPLDRNDLVMDIGNAGGVEFVIDEKILPPLGRNGQVRRNLKLDYDYWKNLENSAE